MSTLSGTQSGSRGSRGSRGPQGPQNILHMKEEENNNGARLQCESLLLKIIEVCRTFIPNLELPILDHDQENVGSVCNRDNLLLLLYGHYILGQAWLVRRGHKSPDRAQAAITKKNKALLYPFVE